MFWLCKTLLWFVFALLFLFSSQYVTLWPWPWSNCLASVPSDASELPLRNPLCSHPPPTYFWNWWLVAKWKNSIVWCSFVSLQLNSPQDTVGNAGMWGWALVVFAPSGRGPDLVRTTFQKNWREFGCGGRGILYRFFSLRFRSLTADEWAPSPSFKLVFCTLERLHLLTWGNS